jgi:hypothetical protein
VIDNPVGSVSHHQKCILPVIVRGCSQDRTAQKVEERFEGLVTLHKIRMVRLVDMACADYIDRVERGLGKYQVFLDQDSIIPYHTILRPSLTTRHHTTQLLVTRPL